MPISVKCDCGKKTTVGDPLAGKTIRCPGCGGELYIPASSAPAGAVGGRPGKPVKKASAGPAIHISSGTVTFLSVGGIIVLGILMFVFGPVRVWREWNARESAAKDEVTNVIDFAIKAYLSERGGYNPRYSHGAPAVLETEFFAPGAAMSMPEFVQFHGKTNQGGFSGKYNTRTGEVEANVDYGSRAVVGVPTATKGVSTITITGRDKNHAPAAELNGTPLKIVFPPPDE